MLDGAEASRPRSKGVDRCAEVGFREVWPQRLEEQELGVGALPEEEVAQPLFASGSNEQIDGERGRTAVGVREALLESLARELVLRDSPHGVENGISRGVVDGQAEVKPGRRLRTALGGFDAFAERRREPIAPAHDREAELGRERRTVAGRGVFGEEIWRGRVLREELAEEVEQAIDLCAGPLPVV